MFLSRRNVVVLVVTALTMVLASASSAEAYVYWGNGDRPGVIGRANLDGSAVDNSFITGLDLVYGLAVDGAHVYWDQNVSGTAAIGRANLDGSAPNLSFINAGVPYVKGVAVDGAHIYWANPNTGTIGRANLDGSVVDQSFITGLGSYLVDVAVDGAHIYWGNASPGVNQGTGTIGRANLDGSAVNKSFIAATVPSNSAVANSYGPWGLAVDGAHIYWTNGDSAYYGGTTRSTVGRANLDGSGVNLSLVDAGVNRPAGVAVDGTHIYWATGSGTIGRADLDGSSPNQSFIASGRAEWLAVDALQAPAAPTVASFTPAPGPVGTVVTLTGSDFSGASAVTFNGPAAATFSGVSATQITATVPAGATTGTIAVTTPGGTGASAASFTVTTPLVTPTVTLKLSGLRSGALKLGKRVTAKGTVTPSSLAGSKVKLTVQKKKGARWVTLKSTARTISLTGAYSWKYKPAKKGAYRMRATIAKSATNTAAKTKWRTFKVK